MITMHENSVEDLHELLAIEEDSLAGLFSEVPDLAERTEEILAQEITTYSGWTWKTSYGKAYALGDYPWR
jgi:hypothetical protein